MKPSSYIACSDSWFYHRPNLTTQISNMCKDTLFSRMVYCGERQIGKSCFFLDDLCPIMIQEGMMPIYVNMRGSSPHIQFAIQLNSALDGVDFDKGVLNSFASRYIKKLTIENMFANEDVKCQPKAATNMDLSIIKLLLKLVVKSAGNSKIVFILDEFQNLSVSTVFDNFLYALRTHFDTFASRITVIFVGSNSIGMKSLFEEQKAAFYHSAQMNQFPIIDDGFIDYCVNRLKDIYHIHINKIELLDFWSEVSHSPYWVVRLMREMVEHENTLTHAIANIRVDICEEKR